MPHNKTLKWICPLPLHNSAALEQLDATLGVVLPSSLKKIIAQHNAASPEPREFVSAAGDHLVFERLLSANSSDRENILEIRELLGRRLPKFTVPFAADPYGNMICLQYASNKDGSPRVVFWNHEEQEVDRSCSVVAGTFDEFLNMLQ